MKETNVKIGFVILHYQAYKETIECIESIKRNVKKGIFEIIVVDNFSPNKSGEIIKNKYKNEENFYFIQAEKNLGFANGNNLGFKYAKDILKCDFIVCLNNDTLLLNNNFVKEIIQEYKKSKFAVMAPKVFLNDNLIQEFNFTLKKTSDYEVELSRWNNLDKTLFEYKPTLKSKIVKAIGPIGIPIKRTRQILKGKFNYRKENVLLHGCFLIFSPNYIRLFDGFDDRTFMFREEELLYIRLRKYNLLSVYNPKITIRHLEDAATNLSYKTSEEKQRFLQENQIKSLKILIEELRKNDI